MVVSNIHLPTLEDLDPETHAEMMELATTGMSILRKVYQPEGFNFGANIGAAAGAGIAGHVHLHVVPRWRGTRISCRPWLIHAYCQRNWAKRIDITASFLAIALTAIGDPFRDLSLRPNAPSAIFLLFNRL